MPGPLRPTDEGLIYHVIHRGNNRREVFHESGDLKKSTSPLSLYATKTMRLPTPPWRRQSDEEYIAKLRRFMAFWGRWRRWMIALQIVLLAALTWFMLRAANVVLEMGEHFGEVPIIMGLVMGGIFGIAMGWTFYSIIHGLIFALLGHRTEKLLLKHYDATSGASEPTTQSAPKSETDVFLRENRGR